MDQFLLSERFRLELHWEKVETVEGNVCVLEDAYFSGPVLRIAEKINSDEFITLDFTKQYYVLVPNYYIVKLSWGQVIYRNNNVKLDNVKLIYNKYLDEVPMLKNHDYLIIDTRGHEFEEHYRNLVYYSYVVDREGILYNFRRN